MSAVPCVQCGLPARAHAEESQAFCCVGCSLAWHFQAGADSEEGSQERLEPRLLVSAFLSMGVMVASLVLYGDHFADSEALAAAQAEGGEAYHALRGLVRGAALLLATPVLHLLGGPLLWAVLRTRRFLSADGLVLLASGAAYFVSAWNTVRGVGDVYFDTATMVLVLVAVGRLLDGRARQRARGALGELAPKTVRSAVRVRDGAEETCNVEAVTVGDIVRVRPGQELTVDGTVIAGRAFVDSADLTGEEDPRGVDPGSRVLAGMRPLDGYLDVRAEAVAEDRVQEVTRSLLKEALARRGRTARLADRVAGWFLPVVLGLALVTLYTRSSHVGLENAWLDALAVLLIACPCALGIATPLALWTALGEAWRRGILVRGGDVLERLAAVRRVWFDKTGTLTRGDLQLRDVEVLSGTRDEALRTAAALELGSEHPIGRVLRGAAGEGAALPLLEDFQVLPGRGVQGRVDGSAWDLVRSEEARRGQTSVVLRREEVPVARFHLESSPRPETAEVLAALREQGLELAVLTGDSRGAGEAIGRQLGVPVTAELLPQEKLARVRDAGTGCAYVGDGLNDVAALAVADVGIAVRDASPASLRAAGVSLLGEGLDHLPELLRLARRARAVARLNLVWAFGYNVIGLALAMRGELTPVFAASAMVISSLAVTLHSRRATLPTGREDATHKGPQARPEPGTMIESELGRAAT